jgi:acetyl-CoA synthetase
MSDRYSVPPRVAEGSESPVPTIESWRETWLRAQADPDGFWLDITHRRVAWQRPPTVGLNGNFRSVHDGPLSWFADGVLNVTETCLDQHLATRADKVALLWQGDEPDDVRRITYAELHQKACQAAGA